MPNWENQKSKAEQMQVYLDAWFAQLVKRYPVYKNYSAETIKNEILKDNFDPIFSQAWESYKKMDKYFDRLRGEINGNS